MFTTMKITVRRILTGAICSIVVGGAIGATFAKQLEQRHAAVPFVQIAQDVADTKELLYTPSVAVYNWRAK